MRQQHININDKQINLHLMEYQVEDEDWTYSELIDSLHEWFDRFNASFALRVPTPAFGIRKIHKRKWGTYLMGQNQHGLHYEIIFNSQHLDPFCEMLATLVHQMMHLRQHLYGEPPESKRSGHNDEFRHWMSELGILSNRYGHDTVEEGPFTELLREHGIEYEAPIREPKKPRKKTVKWACRARCYEIPVPEEETLELECKRCNSMLEKP